MKKNHVKKLSVLISDNLCPSVVHFFFLSALFITGCGRQSTPEEEAGTGEGSKGRMNVLLMTIDTLRADYVGCYSADAPDTPAIDGLGRAGALFLNATATAPLTLPSHASIFTGSYPPSHGVRDNIGFKLSEGSVTLAEILRENGWRTAGFVSAYVLHSGFGISQGFDEYFDRFDFDPAGGVMSPDNIQRRGDETVDEALSWMERNNDAPFYMWVHLFDPHAPYDPPKKFGALYPDDPYSGEVAFTDFLVGRLLGGLERTGLSQDTLVILVGDHGEGLGSHRERFHGLFVYDSTLQVPFIIKAPGFSPQTIESQVRLVDVMPTILDMLGLRAPDGIAGTSLMPLVSGKTKKLGLAAYSESWYPNLHYGWSELMSIRAGRYKYILAPDPELYDLADDPGETKNLVHELPEVARKMKGNLDAMMTRLGASAEERPEPGDVDPRSAEALRMLGYTGAQADTASSAGGGRLADPKEKVDLLWNLYAAQRMMSDGNSSGAVSLLEKIVEQEPGMIDAALTLGAAYMKTGNMEAALDVFRVATERAPDLFTAWANLGLAQRACGKMGAAKRSFERSLELDPSNMKTLEQMIDTCFRTASFRKCERFCRRFLDADPGAVRIRCTLAMVLINMRRAHEAADEARRVIELEPSAEKAHYILGKTFESERDYRGAEAEYRMELSRYRDNPDTFHSLAGVLDKLGRGKEAIEILEASVRQHPVDFLSSFLLAKAFLKAGIRNEKGLDAARRAKELNPSSREAQELLRMLKQ